MTSWKGFFVFIALVVFSPVSQSQKVDYQFEGTDQQDIINNIRLHWQNVERPDAAEDIGSYQKKLEEAALPALQAYGYYNALLSFSFNTEAPDWTVTTRLDLNEPVRITNVDIRLDGEGQQDDAFQQVIQSLQIEVGSVLFHPSYEDAKKRLNNVALTRGYFDFNWQKSEIAVSVTNNEAVITLHADTGIRYRFGELMLSGDVETSMLIHRLKTFESGQFYESDLVASFHQRLSGTGYFERTIVRPVAAQKTENTVPIQVIAYLKPRDNYELGGGLSSDVGARLRAKWQRPWVNTRGHSIFGDLYLTEPEQSLSLGYKIPLRDTQRNYMSFKTGFQRTDDNDTRADNISLSFQRHWADEDSNWQHVGFLRYEREDFTQGDAPSQSTNLFVPGYSGSYLKSDGSLDVAYGNRHLITTEFAAKEFGSDINMVRVNAMSKWIRSFSDHRFILRAEVGAIGTDDFDAVPPSLRFFTGGDQTVRGFDYKTLSPQSVNEDTGERFLTGAQYLAVASAEYSYRLSDSWRANLFIDTGTATNDFDEDPAIGYGIGATWLSVIGPVRVYVAKGESDLEGLGGYEIHVSLGPTL